MIRKQIQPGVMVIHKKHHTVEKILYLCKIRNAFKQWEDGVVYAGEDRYNPGTIQVYSRTLTSFMEDFKIITGIPENYISTESL